MCICTLKRRINEVAMFRTLGVLVNWRTGEIEKKNCIRIEISLSLLAKGRNLKTRAASIAAS